jgi:hypothetical protein
MRLRGTMIGKIYRRKKGSDGDPDFLGRLVFDAGDIASFATVGAFSDIQLGKVTNGIEYFISMDGTSDTLLWKILGVMELPFEKRKEQPDTYKLRLTMDKLPG